MRWLPIARKDGKPDPYAVGLCTHTVSSIFIGGRPTFEAWRLKSPAIRLGRFNTFSEAQNACLKDDSAQVAA